jgi:hypothetical protein
MHNDAKRICINYINIQLHFALSGNTKLHPIKRHESFRARPLGTAYVMGFGEQGVGRKLFGHNREKVIVTGKKNIMQSLIICCLH